MKCIEIQDLHFTYPSRDASTLRGINVEVPSGEFILLTGPTGCGKSTLMRVLNGLIPHASGGKFSGSVSINGMNVADQPLAVTCQQVGLLFQNPEDQLFCIVVEDEVAFGLENLGVPPPEINRRIDSALEQVGLTGFRSRSLISLSGGEKQRVALACLCVMSPKILLLDEPTSHLDPQGTLDILEVVRRLNQELGITIIIAGHQVNEIAPLCDRVWLMNAGQLISDLAIDQAFRELEPYYQLGVQVPELVQIAQQLGFSEHPLTLDHATRLFASRQASKQANQQIGETTNHKPTAWGEYLDNRVERLFCSVEGHSPTSPLTHRAATDSFPLVTVEDLTFRYPRTSVDVLKNVSFQVNCGEVVAIMGANGSGKTTLLWHLIALLRPSGGKVFIKGRDTKRYKPHHLAGQVGVVFQNPDLLLQAATVADEIVFGPKNLKLSRQAVQHRLEEILLMLDLEDLKTEAPYALSRGQRQRTAIAATLSLYPDLLLLDEPTTGQDRHHLQQLMGTICNVIKKQHKTMIFCTHNTHLMLKYANRVLLLHRGELIFDGTPGAAFADPERLKRVSLIPTLTMQLHHRMGK